MRVNTTLYYVLKDHLGSASVVTNSSGTIVGEDRFYAFGETRFTTGTMYTDKLFTGQRQIAELGIYHYQARFYSPKLGRFLSADTIVPSYANPQSLNRFSYVVNNPLRYIDPTGHIYLDNEYGYQGMDCGDSVFNDGGSGSGDNGGGGGNNDNDDDEDDNGGSDYCSTHPGACGNPLPDLMTPAEGSANNYSCFNNPFSCGGGGGHPLASPVPDFPLPCNWLDCALSGVSLVATVVAAVPGTIGVVGFGFDLVATVWAIGRTNDDYRQGEISKTRQYALNITGIVGVLPGGLLGEWAFPVSFTAGLANLLMTATGIPN